MHCKNCKYWREGNLTKDEVKKLVKDCYKMQKEAGSKQTNIAAMQTLMRTIITSVDNFGKTQ